MSERKHMLVFMRWSIEVAVCLYALFAFVPAAMNVVLNRILIWFAPNRPMRPIGPIETFSYYISPWIMLAAFMFMLPFVIHLFSWHLQSRRRDMTTG